MNRESRDRPELDAADQAAVDAYRSRSVWGAWWKLGELTRARYFTGTQRRFIRRYGERLDALACLVDEPRSDAERHFVQVCSGTLAPSNDHERLWLLVQVVCRFEDATARAARVSMAEHRAAALEAEIGGLRVGRREDEHYICELIAELRMHTGEPAPSRRPISNENVTHVSLLFRRRDDRPPIACFMVDASRRWAPLVLPSSKSAIAQWSSSAGPDG